MSQTLHTETQSKGGPRTAAGKAASSKNSFKHGLASGRILIEGEDPAEALLVHDLAKFHWLADRAWPEIPASLNVLIRYQTSSPPVQQTDAGSKTQPRTSAHSRLP